MNGAGKYNTRAAPFSNALAVCREGDSRNPPLPFETGSQLEKNRHSRESGNPGKNRIIESFMLCNHRLRLDARFRGHDELRHRLLPKRGDNLSPLKKEGKAMATTIYYLTGTGNSLWIARTLARELGGAEVISMAGSQENPVETQTLGLVFPVHIWGVPSRVLRFVEGLKGSRPDYLFAVAVNAGQVANTLVQLKKVLSRNGLRLSAGFEIPLPSNYIPWGGPGPKEKQNTRFESARQKMSKIAGIIKGKEKGPIEKGPLWQRVLFSFFYRMSFSQVPKMDRKFWVDAKCDGCAVCSKVCPSENITIKVGKPTWNHRCEQCFACLQWCPKEAIQYGKKTPRYERYHHPDVSLKDLLRSRRLPEQPETQ
jgi:ferredoxin